MSLQLDLLHHHQSKQHEIIHHFKQHWGHIHPERSDEEWGQLLSANKDELPLSLVAIDRTSGGFLGTVTLKNNTVPFLRQHLENFIKPDQAWLFYMYVVPHRRGQGIGSSLLAHAAHLAKHMGFNSVSLFTTTCGNIYRKADWQATGRGRLPWGARAKVMELALQPTAVPAAGSEPAIA